VLAGAALAARVPARLPPPPQTVVSIEFDDGLADQFQALPVLNRFGFHATFFVNSGRIGKAAHMSLSELVALAGAGNEIGGHTVDHVDLPALPPAAARHEVCDDRRALRALGFSAPDFAYPYGAVAPALERIVAACGYQSGRAIGHLAWARGCLSCPWAETIPPADRYATRTPMSIHADTSLAAIESYVTTAQSNGGGWVQIVLHHVCTACNPYGITPLDLAALLQWLAERAGEGIAVRTAHEVIARVHHRITNVSWR
jgi:peptidoglycan/xylan/chitin deacetylase (PgdA/CDA1 family)